jgi:hypothetical protein
MDVFDIVSRIETADDARNLMENAKNKNRMDVYQATFRRLGQIEGRDHSDPVIAQFWAAISAVEETLRQKHGKAVKANYTRRKVKKVGEIQCLIDWAFKSQETEGFRLLVDAGLGDQTGEYVLVKNSDRFPADAVAAAKKRLVENGVLSTPKEFNGVED